MSLDNAFEGFDCKEKKSNVCVAREFCFILHVLFFLVVEINTGIVAP